MLSLFTSAVGLLIGFLFGAWYTKRGYRVQFVEPSDKHVRFNTKQHEVTQFLDAVSPRERFDKAENVADLLTK